MLFRLSCSAGMRTSSPSTVTGHSVPCSVTSQFSFAHSTPVCSVSHVYCEHIHSTGPAFFSASAAVHPDRMTVSVSMSTTVCLLFMYSFT